ncbi:MAG: hypothetical protein L0L22_14245, partial [Staphylococcus equorum]|nr:hypothetical protein [Staphylococcus equorum]
IVFLMRKISNHKITYIFCFLLILLIPVSFYSQTYGWLAGFANYNTSTFFFLWLIFLVKKNKVTFLSLTAIFILSMLTQLFIENISISSILIAIIGLAIAVFFKESILPYLSWLLGAISGAIIMFSNSAYHIEGNMRGFSNADVHTFSVRLLTDWTELYVKQNALLLVLFSIVMYLLIENKNLGIFIFFFFPSGYFALRYLMNITWRQQSMFALVIELLLILIFLATLAITIGKSSIPLSGKRHFFSYITISLLLVAPFLIVTPYGPRNILTSFVFLGLALFELISYIKINLESQLVKKISLLFIFCISIFFIGMHGLNKYEENQRIAQLKQDVALGQKEVELNRLPYEFIGHDLTPPDGSVQSDRQKKYHNISIDTKFKITGYHDSALDNLLEKQQ